MTTTEENQMGPEQPRHVCHACIGDKVLAQQVEEAGTHAKCSYCHVAGNTTTLTELAEWIHQVLEEHFERIPILLENQNDEPDATDDISEQLRNLLDDTETVIERVANLDPSIACDVREYMFNNFTESVDANRGGENPYNSDMLYQELESDASNFRLAWWDFREEIQSRARYFGTAAEAKLEEIFANLNLLKTLWRGPVVREINPGDKDSSFWRARAVYSESELKRILDSPTREIGPPPSNKAKAGRMNAEGIQVFYGASDVETCVAEIRPPVGSYVVLGKFDLLTPVRILDFGALSITDSGVSHFDQIYSQERSREKFLRVWVEEISRPVMPHDEAREYIPTQAVADYLANRVDPRLDGIIFPSSQTGGGGRNVVLFNHACRAMADEPNPVTGRRLRVPRQPTIPQPGTEPSSESTVQTDPPKPREEGERQGEVIASDDLAAKSDGRNSTLRLDPASLKFLKISGVNHKSDTITESTIHFLTGTLTFEPMSSTAILSKRNPQ